MSSVGPQLPPHLSKRKRSPSDPDPPSSPPHKVVARTLGPALPPPPQNPDEVDLGEEEEGEEDSGDGYGPSIPSAESTSSAKIPVGPSPPGGNPDEVRLEERSDDDDDDYGPPPPTKAQPVVAEEGKGEKTKQRRILGPAPPPAPLSEMPSHPSVAPADESSSSEEEDDYGPSLPPPPGSHAEMQALRAREEEEQQRLRAADGGGGGEKKMQREEWMVVPPTSGDWTSRIDSTKLKSRKFNSGKGAVDNSKKAGGGGGGISAIWTETPEEKRRRVEDEVLGRRELGSSGGKDSKGGRDGDERGKREDGEISRRIREMRGRSLLEIRSEGGAAAGDGKDKEEEDDPSQRGFDREKDMALGGRLGRGEKREMLAKAKDFGSRFERGRFL